MGIIDVASYVTADAPAVVDTEVDGRGPAPASTRVALDVAEVLVDGVFIIVELAATVGPDTTAPGTALVVFVESDAPTIATDTGTDVSTVSIVVVELTAVAVATLPRTALVTFVADVAVAVATLGDIDIVGVAVRIVADDAVTDP